MEAKVKLPPPRLEYRILRQELLLRIGLQNAVLILTTLMFFVAGMLAMAMPRQAEWICLIYVIASGAGALQWCHHGIRTKQIVDFLRLQETGDLEETWSKWLPANRPATLLGARWVISTKGVFLATQVSLIVGAWWAHNPSAMLMLLALTGAATTATFLFTNPEE